MQKNLKKEIIVVKVGSNVLVNSNGQADLVVIKNIVEQLTALAKSGKTLLLITSGAVALGKNIKQNLQVKEDNLRKQVWAGMGQVNLLNIYAQLFTQENLKIAQILLSKSDFADRQHYLNIRNCLHALLQENIIPVINENDTVALQDATFTDNDELASIVATMLSAQKLIILTNVKGLLTDAPERKGAKLIKEVDINNMNIMDYVKTTKSQLGRGGMLNKCKMALKTASLGIDVYIAAGKEEKTLLKLAGGRRTGTWFKAATSEKVFKKWLAFSKDFSKGKIIIDAKLAELLLSKKAVSILPVGIKQVEGNFVEGDLISVLNQSGKEIGLGLAKHSAKVARKHIGVRNVEELIHYNYLCIY